MSKIHTAEIIAFPDQSMVVDYAIAAGDEDLVGFAASSALPQLAEVIPLHPYPEYQPLVCGAARAECLDWLAPKIDAAYSQAEAILQRNRDSLFNGDFESVPLDVDALSTAQKLRETGQRYGLKSPQYQEVHIALEMDCDRKLDEAESRTKWRYFDPIVYNYDASTDEITSNGLSYDEMVLTGLSPIGDPEGVARRPHDYVKNDINKALIKKAESESVAVIHTSLCPDYAIELYKDDPKGSHDGYAPEVEKLMIGFETFSPQDGKIYHEQIALPGKFITTEVVNEAYCRIGLIEDGDDLDKTEIYAIQGLVETQSYEDVFSFVAVIDGIASEMSGLNIFLGEAVDWDHPKDYTAAKEEAAREKELRAERTQKLVEYVKSLEAKGTEHSLGTFMQSKFIKQMLLEASVNDPKIAAAAFDHDTARGFYMAQDLRARGLFTEAQLIVENVSVKAPEVSGCGGDGQSCGLQELNLADDQDLLASSILKAKPGEKVIKDSVRKCKCGGSVYYAFNAKSYRKLCIDCRTQEKDGSIVK